MIPSATPLAPRRALVTGARGFIGRHLVERLSESGYEVHATTRRPQVATSLLAGSAAWHQCDGADAEATTRLVRLVSPDVIFHLASDVAGSRDPQLVVPMLHGNLSSAVNLMTAGLECGVGRMVSAGSIEEPDPASSASLPNSPYSAAKGAATMYARMFAELWNLPITVLRIAMVYGPAQPDHRKLVPHVISSFLEGRSPELTTGDRIIDWIYVDDVVDALVAAAQVPSTGGDVIPIGSGCGASIHEVVETIQELLHTELPAEFGALADRPLDRVRIADTALADELLGWKAQTSLREGLMRTIEWHRSAMSGAM